VKRRPASDRRAARPAQRKARLREVTGQGHPTALAPRPPLQGLSHRIRQLGPDNRRGTLPDLLGAPHVGRRWVLVRSLSTGRAGISG
jgi:hypothetical protein